MWFRLSFLALLAVAIAVPALAQDAPRLDSARPNPILVESGPRVNVITLYGNGFIIGGHPDYYQYDHLQYRKVDPSGAPHDWVRCARPNCQYASGSGTEWTLDLIDHDTFASPGFIEWRFWTGLGVAEANDPSEGASMVSGWSNTLRIPIVTALPTATPKPTPTPTPTPKPIKVQRAAPTFDNPNLSPRDRNPGVTNLQPTPTPVPAKTVPVMRPAAISPALSGAMSGVLAAPKLHTVCEAPLYADGNGTPVMLNGQTFIVRSGMEVTPGEGTVQSPNGTLRRISIQIPGTAAVDGYFPVQCLH